MPYLPDSGNIDSISDRFAKIKERLLEGPATSYPCIVSTSHNPYDRDKQAGITDLKVVRPGNCRELCKEMYGI